MRGRDVVLSDGFSRQVRRTAKSATSALGAMVSIGEQRRRTESSVGQHELSMFVEPGTFNAAQVAMALLRKNSRSNAAPRPGVNPISAASILP